MLLKASLFPTRSSACNNCLEIGLTNVDIRSNIGHFELSSLFAYDVEKFTNILSGLIPDLSSFPQPCLHACNCIFRRIFEPQFFL